MKILASVISDIEVSNVINVPPRNSQLPRSASIAAIEKHTKTNVVPNKAVTIIEGSTTLIYCSNGPNPIPESKINNLLNKLFYTK